MAAASQPAGSQKRAPEFIALAEAFPNARPRVVAECERTVDGLYAGDRVRRSVGPTITLMIDFIDGTAGERFVVEDDGYPNLPLSALRASVGDGVAGALSGPFREYIEQRPAGDVR